MGCSHSTRVADPLPPSRPVVNATTHAYGGSPRSSSPSQTPNTKPTQPSSPTTQPPANPAQPRAASNPTPSSPAPQKPAPKLPKTKSQPQMVNLRTADQVLTSPSQVAYPSTAYILGLTRKKQEEARERAGRTEAEERNAPGEVGKPGGVVYLSAERFRELTAKRAADECHGPLPPSPSHKSNPSVSAPRAAGFSGGSETSESMSQRASSSSRPSVETAYSSGDSLYMDCSD